MSRGNNILCFGVRLTVKASKLFGFTLAEVLITLGIIGIVAALTLPAIMSNCNKLSTEIALKKTYAELQQVFKLSEVENGEFESWDFSLSSADFVKQYIMPYMKISPCNSKINCFVSESSSPNGRRTWYLPDGNTKETEGATLSQNISPNYITIDGRSIKFRVVVDTVNNQRYLNIFVDVNGPKGRTIIGRDVFAFYRAAYEVDYYDSRKTHTQVHMGTGSNGGAYWRVLKNKYISLDSCAKNGKDCGAYFEANNFKFPKDYPIKF